MVTLEPSAVSAKTYIYSNMVDYIQYHMYIAAMELSSIKCDVM